MKLFSKIIKNYQLLLMIFINLLISSCIQEEFHTHGNSSYNVPQQGIHPSNNSFNGNNGGMQHGYNQSTHPTHPHNYKQNSYRKQSKLNKYSSYQSKQVNNPYISKEDRELYSTRNTDSSNPYEVSYNPDNPYNISNANVKGYSKRKKYSSNSNEGEPVKVSWDNSYKIKKNDTLWGLSRRYGVTIEEIRKQNNIIGHNLHSGKTIKVPTSTTKSGSR